MKKILLSILLVLLAGTTSNSFPPPASPSLNSIVGLWASGSCTGFLKSDGTCPEGTVDETDPIVGAITGIVKANGAGTISAASAGTDYVAPTSAVGISLKLGDHAGTYSFSILGDDDSVAFSIGSNGVMGGISSFIPPYKEAAPTAYQLEWDTNFLTSRAALCGHDNTGVVCFSGSDTAPSADGQFLIFDNDAKAYNPHALSGDATMTDGGVVTVAKATGNFTIGADTDGSDYALTFDGNASNLSMTWMEDESELRIADSANEGLDIDLNTATDNEVEIRSGNGKGVTRLSFSTLNLVTTGTISGRIPVATDADGKTLTKEECSGSMQMATGAGTWTLPDIDASDGTGWSVCIYTTGADDVNVNPDDEDKIRAAGTLLAAGAEIDPATAAAGNFVCLMVTDSDSDIAIWTTMGMSGTWN